MSGDTGVMGAKTLRIGGPAVARPRIKQGVRAPRTHAKEELKKQGAKALNETTSVTGVSAFAIFGTLIISTLMVFVVLAQINYNETASESARLSTQVRDLTEERRTLELAFESSFDIREVERIAIDELGMTRPSAEQMLTITTIPYDTAVVVIGDESDGRQGFTEFLKSLIDYFK